MVEQGDVVMAELTGMEDDEPDGQGDDREHVRVPHPVGRRTTRRHGRRGELEVSPRVAEPGADLVDQFRSGILEGREQRDHRATVLGEVAMEVLDELSDDLLVARACRRTAAARSSRNCSNEARNGATNVAAKSRSLLGNWR